MFGICIHNLGRVGGGERERERERSSHLIISAESYGWAAMPLPSAYCCSPHKSNVFDRNATLLVTQRDGDSMDARNQMECHGSLALSIGKLMALLVNSIAITKKALCTFCLSPLKRDRQRVHAVPSCQEVGNFLSFILRTVLILISFPTRCISKHCNDRVSAARMTQVR